MRTTIWVGQVKGREVLLFPVAWCSCCRASRLLKNPQRWAGWPESEAPVTGQCVGCGSTVSVSSREPSPPAVA